MATEVIKIIDPDNGSGTNYTSLSAWEAGEQGDLTGARDEIAVAKCRCTGGTADTTAVDIAGWTTDTTHYIKIWTDPSESYRHDGKWNTSKYRITSNAYFATICNNNGARLDLWLDGLQIENSREYESGAAGAGLWSYQTYIANITVSNCIIRNTASSPCAGSGVTVLDAADSGTTYFKCYNNIIYGFSGGYDGAGIRYNRTANGATRHIICYNNTLYGNYKNLFLNPNWPGSEPVYIHSKNNLLYNHTGGGDFVRSDDGGTWDVENDLSSDATSLDTSHRNQTVAFVDADNRDLHLSASDTAARGQGTNLSSDSYLPFSTDIDGQDRGGSGASWDIGADEYAAATSGSLPPWMLQRNRRRLNILLRLCLSTFNLIGRCFK